MTPAFFKGKTILVTGATGSIGSEIVRQLLKMEPAVVRIFSRDEHKQFLMSQVHGTGDDVRYFLGDVRDLPRLVRAMEGVDYVFHCAAYKHVPMCEYNSFEAVKTNVIGTQNVIDAARQQNVKRVLFISTDKAAAPSNVMGATKLLAERLISSAMESVGPHQILFSTVRFGNVIGSRGSVIPTFLEQIRKGGPVTITHTEMTRFFMSIPDAVHLTFNAMEQMKGGEVFVLKMPVLRLGDLAEELIEELAPRFGREPGKIERLVVGIRPGERMHETLMTDDEAQYAEETDTMFIVHPPMLSSFGERGKMTPKKTRSYSSGDAPLLDRSGIRDLVRTFLASLDASADIVRNTP